MRLLFLFGLMLEPLAVVAPVSMCKRTNDLYVNTFALKVGAFRPLFA